MSNHVRNVEGMRFGRLVAQGRAGTSPRGLAMWHTVCDCGETKVVVGSELRNGKTSSCGCLQRECRSRNRRTHGMSHHPLYGTWIMMWNRCTNPGHSKYARYGGRGISVDLRWAEFERFLADMGERPPGRTLDRKDNDGPYSPENCRWATAKQQAANRAPIGHRSQLGWLRNQLAAKNPDVLALVDEYTRAS